MTDETEGLVSNKLEGFLAGDPPIEDLAPDDSGQAEIEAEAEYAEGDGQESEEEESAEETDEEIEDDGDEESDAAPQLIEFTVNGKTVSLNPDELEGHYLRHSDYTRKTQELAEQRRTFDVEVQQERAKIQQQMQQIELMAQQESAPDWDSIFEENPLEAPLMHHKWKQSQEAKQQLIYQNQTAAANQRHSHLAEQAKLLPEMIPHWADNSLAERETLELRKALVDDGFANEDVGAITDARLVKWLLAGKRQFELERTAPRVVKKKVAGKPKVLQPGSAKGKQSQRQNFNKKLDNAFASQTPEAFSQVFEDFLK
jgi:hypothetical protein